jgi:hypothetical protein
MGTGITTLRRRWTLSRKFPNIEIDRTRTCRILTHHHVEKNDAGHIEGRGFDAGDLRSKEAAVAYDMK